MTTTAVDTTIDNPIKTSETPKLFIVELGVGVGVLIIVWAALELTKKQAMSNNKEVTEDTIRIWFSLTKLGLFTPRN